MIELERAPGGMMHREYGQLDVGLEWYSTRTNKCSMYTVFLDRNIHKLTIVMWNERSESFIRRTFIRRTR